jgi:hypothetical protein
MWFFTNNKYYLTNNKEKKRCVRNQYIFEMLIYFKDYIGSILVVWSQKPLKTGRI